MIEPPAGPASESRAGLRSNVFLSATVYAGGGPFPARIRNLSVSGALLDGAGLPAEGIAVSLRRGGLSASGTVIWVRECLRGVRFDEAIQVRDWVRPVGHSGQQRVDAIVAGLRSGSYAGIAGSGGEASQDLDQIIADLTKASERLASDPLVMAGFSADLLTLDAAIQRLRQLSASRR